MKTRMLLDDLSTEFIVASKTLNSLDSVMDVYEGYYGDYDRNTSLNALVEILSPIVQAVKEVRLEKVLSDLLPANRWKSGCAGLPNDTPLNEVIVKNLIAELRMVDRDKLFETSAKARKLSLQDFIVEHVLPGMQVLTEEHFPNPETA